MLVRKKVGTCKLCIDHRELSEKKVKDKFLIPIIEELVDAGLIVYNKLNIRSDHQIRLYPYDVFKIAFKTHIDHYEFLVMPFGLTNG